MMMLNNINTNKYNNNNNNMKQQHHQYDINKVHANILFTYFKLYITNHIYDAAIYSLIHERALCIIAMCVTTIYQPYPNPFVNYEHMKCMDNI